MDCLRRLEGVPPDRKSVSRIMVKMVRRRRCYVAQVQLYDFHGQPRKVYCNHRMATPAHDNALAKVFAALGYPDCDVGPEVEPVGGRFPDAVTLHPRPRLWEMDMQTEGYERIAAKVEAYKTQDRAVLWVCPTEARRQKLMRWTKDIHGVSFYALWHELLADPCGPVWGTADGQTRVLTFVPKEVRGV